MVERHLPKVNVAGSSPVFRSKTQPIRMSEGLFFVHMQEAEYVAHRSESRLPLQR